jgi:DNA-binding transcriptional regulator YiaG
LPFCKLTLTAPKPLLSKAYPEYLQTIGDHLRRKRLDLKLYQKDVAQILGLDTTSIWNWENNLT